MTGWMWSQQIMPHILMKKKKPPYEHAHAGLPLVQHSLLLMLHYYKKGRSALKKLLKKWAMQLQIVFRSKKGDIYVKDILPIWLLLILNATTTVTKENILYKCGWSPLEGFYFPGSYWKNICKWQDGLWKWSIGWIIKGQRLNLSPLTPEGRE